VVLATKTSGVDYSLNAATGTITELSEFGAGATVLSSYWTDFVLPATYPLTLNDSPDLGESSGKWMGKSLADGTYSLGIWTSRSLTLNVAGESNSYRSTSDARKVDFLVGSATEVEPYAQIASGSSCFNCHQELAFHGFGRRGFESCVLCHGSAGAEDRPQYVAGNAPDTTGLTISFRTMLHKIHMGEELANASTYDVIGFGSGSYPNNFGVSNFGEILFPALPGGVQNCVKCHGNDAWHEPRPRAHPTEQGAPIRRWAAVCGACHDSTDAQAHVRVQTDALGNESCGVCHSEDAEWSVERVHKPY
jgi:OmcA/MtrC family decaheme c-type cytochrome